MNNNLSSIFMQKLVMVRRAVTNVFLTVLTMMALVCVGSPGALAQTPDHHFSVSFKDKSVPAILDFIGQQGGYTVSYTDEVRNYPTTLTVSFDNVTAAQAAQQLLSHTPFAYSVEGNVLRVYRMESVKKDDGRELTGTVKDNNGEPVPFATLQIKGTSIGVVTDVDGKFTLKVDRDNGTLTATCVGYETKAVPFAVGQPLAIVMHTSVQSIGEVQVIAYGKRNTREMVGAVSSMKAEQLQNVPNPSLETLLQGRMAGVGVSNLSGTPGGGGSQITIRGFSSLNQQGVNDGTPLFVIDGVPVVATSGANTGGINTLAGLDPSSIESVEVLKDAASASLYGSRASNGVILITTKKGKSGRAEFNINVSQTLSWLPATPTQIMGKGERDFATLLAKSQRTGHYDWMEGRTIMPKGYNDTWGWDVNNDGSFDYFWRNGKVLENESRLPGVVQDSLNTFYNNRTNWWDYAFRVGRITKADAQIAGGTDNVRYMVNAGVYDERGIMISSSFRRLSLLSNLDAKLTPKVDAYVRLNMAYANQNAADMGKVQGLTFDPKNTNTLMPGRGSVAEEQAVRNLRDVDRQNSNYNIRAAVGLNYDIVRGLRFSTSFSIDHYATRAYTFTPDYLTYDRLSNINANNVMMTNLQTENLLTYKFDIAKRHNVELLGGFTYNRDLLQSLGGEAKGGPTNRIKYAGEGWPQLRTNEHGTVEALQRLLTNKEEQAMSSFLGRVAYNYKKRYLGEFSIRADGSSVFGSDVRWGTFPSVGLGWAFSEEPFMKPLWWLSFGKLRASWGRSGQKFQEAYLALGIMSEANTFLGSLGLVPEYLANNKLTWEKSDQYDLGLDLQLFDYRLNVKLDYYYKYSDALLMQTSLPGNFFFANKIWSNASAISNEGIELEVSADVIRRDDLRWTLGFNLSRNHNLFRKSFNGEDLSDKVLGRPVYGIYTFKDEGIVQSEDQIPYYYNQQGKRTPLYFISENNPLRVGGRKIKDQNMDGRIDNDDVYYAGSTLPAAYGGVNSRLTWKGLTLDVLFSYMIDRKMMNMVKGSAFALNKNFGVIMNDYRKYTFWKKPGEKADYPSMEFADESYLGQYDGNIDSNIERVSFLRLKQVVLGYNVPEKWLKKLFVKGVNLYVSGENLFLLTNYSGLDPEIVNPYTGKDTGDQYPLNRKVTFGVKLKF